MLRISGTLSHKGRGKKVRHSHKKGPGRNRGPIRERQESTRLLVGALIEGGAENVPQRRPRIGGAVLRGGFLFFGDVHGFSRHLTLTCPLAPRVHPPTDLSPIPTTPR